MFQKCNTLLEGKILSKNVIRIWYSIVDDLCYQKLPCKDEYSPRPRRPTRPERPALGQYWPLYADRSPCLATTASRDELRHDRLDTIGGDGKANAIGGRIELGIDSGECGNADHVALQVYE